MHRTQIFEMWQRALKTKKWISINAVTKDLKWYKNQFTSDGWSSLGLIIEHNCQIIHSIEEHNSVCDATSSPTSSSQLSKWRIEWHCFWTDAIDVHYFWIWLATIRYILVQYILKQTTDSLEPKNRGMWNMGYRWNNKTHPLRELCTTEQIGW